ncbi:hypothetical protein, partial [Treponema sp. R6D11]
VYMHKLISQFAKERGVAFNSKIDYNEIDNPVNSIRQMIADKMGIAPDKIESMTFGTSMNQPRIKIKK